MLKSEDPAQREEYFNLASMHNLRFIIKLAQDARQAVLDGTFFEFKKNFLARYQKSESHKAGNTAPATENS